MISQSIPQQMDSLDSDKNNYNIPLPREVEGLNGTWKQIRDRISK